MSEQQEIGMEWEGITGRSAPGPGRVPFEVPPGYFEGIPDLVFNKIHDLQNSGSPTNPAELPGILSSFPRVLPYEVPEAYFEDGALEARIREVVSSMDHPIGEEDMPWYSPVLEKIPRVSPYQVEPGYFENLGTRITGRLKASRNRKAQIIWLNRNPGRLLKIAAAALVLILIGLGTRYYLGTRRDSLDKQLARISDRDIEAYLSDQTNLINQDLIYTNVNANNLEVLIPGSSLNQEDIRQFLGNSLERDSVN